MRLFAIMLYGANLSLIANPAVAQEAETRSIEYAGSHPPDTEAIAVAMEYAAANRGYSSAEKRAEQRTQLVSPGYFRHGLDGHPVGIANLSERQTNTDLPNASRDEIFDVVFHQYENTALVTYKTWHAHSESGQERPLLSSGMTVLSRTEDGWMIVSDFIGRAPSDEHVPVQIRRMQASVLAEERMKRAERDAAERRMQEAREAAEHRLGAPRVGASRGGIPTCPGDPRCPDPQNGKD